MEEDEKKEKIVRDRIINDPKIKALRIKIKKRIEEARVLAHQLAGRVSELQKGKMYAFNIEVLRHKADKICFKFPNK